MNKTVTEVVFILDKSGSMHGLEKDTIGGYNSFLEKQKKEDGICLVSTILFSSTSKTLFLHQDISSINEMKEEDYHASGCTALLDALGESITGMESYLEEKDERRNILYVIITDGKENSSRKYDYGRIKEMISEKQELGWQFLFLASNINAEEEADHIGISRRNTVNFHNDSKGIEKNFLGISKAVRMMSACNTFSSSWREEIDEDFKNRK